MKQNSEVVVGTKLIAFNESARLYFKEEVALPNGLTSRRGYIEYIDGDTFDCDIDDMYSRGYWNPIVAD